MQLTFSPAPDQPTALRLAASLAGIESEYYDIWGKHHIVEPEVIGSILSTLGVPVGTLEQLNNANSRRLSGPWTHLAPPTIVAFADECTIPISITAANHHLPYALTIHWESGHIDEKTGSLEHLETTATAEFDSIPYLRKSITLPRTSPLGYHTAELRIGTVFAHINIVLCPHRAYVPPQLADSCKAAGLAVSLYSLRSDRNWGCGDFTDLRAFVEWGAKLGLSFIALNPLHSIPNRQPYNTSPYLPTSILYRNILYLDVTAVKDAPQTEPLKAKALRETPHVEYERVYKLKRKALRAAFRKFLQSDGKSHPDFLDYLKKESQSLVHFARFCALDEWIHRENPNIWLWTDWPPEYRHPKSPAVEEFARKHWRSVMFYQWAQWQVDLQLASVQAHAKHLGMSIGLYHDLALATDRTGADVWAHRDFYMSGCRVGSPPDDFSPEGQDWAFPPPNSTKHFESGYSLFAEGIRKTVRHGGALRIDHVMRLFRLFWIPDGRKATAGAYVKDRFDDLLKILALESVRAEALVVGEDLGTVGDETRASLASYGILSYRLFFFEKHWDGRFRAPNEYPAQALASTTTHDLPTLAGFWKGRDIEVRQALGFVHDDREQREQRQRDKQCMAEALATAGLLKHELIDTVVKSLDLPHEVHEAVIAFLASTPCQLFALNQEDLTNSTEQMNLPGTTAEYPNWRQKMLYSLEQLTSNQEAIRVTSMFKHWLRESGRTM